MAAQRRTHRGERRRSLGQNFLRAELAERWIEAANLRAGELVLEIGPGAGAVTFALARRGVEVVAVERDPELARGLRAQLARRRVQGVRVLEADVRALALPRRPFRAIGALPFGATTDILRKLFDDPGTPLERADLIVQWEVARKRAESPPRTLLSTVWAQWWEFELGFRIPASAFKPVPSVDAATLAVTRRAAPLLPSSAARDYAEFVRARWPFA